MTEHLRKTGRAETAARAVLITSAVLGGAKVALDHWGIGADDVGHQANQVARRLDLLRTAYADPPTPVDGNGRPGETPGDVPFNPVLPQSPDRPSIAPMPTATHTPTPPKVELSPTPTATSTPAPPREVSPTPTATTPPRIELTPTPPPPSAPPATRIPTTGFTRSFVREELVSVDPHKAIAASRQIVEFSILRDGEEIIPLTRVVEAPPVTETFTYKVGRTKKVYYNVPTWHVPYDPKTVGQVDIEGSNSFDLSGHVDRDDNTKMVMADLLKVQVGDVIPIRLKGGSIKNYVVSFSGKVQDVNRYMGPTSEDILRLGTCYPGVNPIPSTVGWHVEARPVAADTKLVVDGGDLEPSWPKGIINVIQTSVPKWLEVAALIGGVGTGISVLNTALFLGRRNSYPNQSSLPSRPGPEPTGSLTEKDIKALNAVSRRVKGKR